MPDRLVFVNYKNPVQQVRDQELRRTVASHIGKHYRNRSKPLQRQTSHTEQHSPHNFCFAIANPVSDDQASPRASSLRLFKGNSDPFESHVVKVDPYISGVIAFYRDVAAPAMSNTSPRGWTFWQSTALGRRDSSDTLRGPCTAFGFLARAALMASKLTPSLLPRALALLGQSMCSLTRALETGHDFHYPTNYKQILVLFSTETLSGNQNAAAVHGTILGAVFEAQKQSGNIDYAMLHYALWMDAHFSAIFLVPTLFNAEHWCSEELGSLDARPEPLLDKLSDVSVESLHNSITDPSIRGVLLVSRGVIELWQQYYSGEIAPSERGFLWLFYRVLICQQQIIEIYLSAVRGGSVHGVFEQCILLATLIWVRKLIFQLNIGGFGFYDAIPSILIELEASLKLAQEKEPQGWEKSPHALFWVLFSAAQVEQDPRRFHRQQSSWLTQGLITQAQALDLLTWEPTIEILRMFVFSDLVEPHGAKWFPPFVEHM